MGFLDFLSNLTDSAVRGRASHLAGRREGEEIQRVTDLDERAASRADRNARTQEGFLRQQSEARQREEQTALERIQAERAAKLQREQLLESQFPDLNPLERAFYSADPGRVEKLLQERRNAAAGPKPATPSEQRAAVRFQQGQSDRAADQDLDAARAAAENYARAASEQPESIDDLRDAANRAISTSYPSLDPGQAGSIVDRAFKDLNTSGGLLLPTPTPAPGDSGPLDPQSLDAIIDGMTPEQIAALLGGGNQ